MQSLKLIVDRQEKIEKITIYIHYKDKLIATHISTKMSHEFKFEENPPEEINQENKKLIKAYVKGYAESFFDVRLVRFLF